jgi:hypothetical protein
VSSRELWNRYDGGSRVALAVVLALITLALLTSALRLRGPIRPPPFGRPLVVTLLVLWPVSIVAFLVALTIYGDQLEHDYPSYDVPQSPILPVTLSAAVVTFLVLVIVRRGSDRGRFAGAVMGALAAPLVFELPFDLIVMARTTPPVLPHPGLWRLLFFAPLFAVELCTIALLLAVPGVRITRWTLLALAALFLTFTLWSTIGFGFPDHPLTYLANVVSKLCAFAVTWTMLWPGGAGMSPNGVVDQHGGDGGGGGEGVAVEDSGAGRGAVEQQRQLFAELFGVGGAGLAGGLGEPCGDGDLVVACVLGGRVLGVVELDGRCDVGAQGSGRGHLEGGEESFARGEVGAVEHPRHDVGIQSPQVLGDQFVLAREVLVRRALGHLGHRAELVHAGAVDALIAEQLL